MALIWNPLYLSQNGLIATKLKSKHIDWILGINCDHHVWPWPWPWPWIFKDKYGICHISAKKWSNCHEMKNEIIDWTPGPRFNIKISSYQYRKSHCGGKTVVRSSYLHNRMSCTGKMASSYWIRVLASNVAICFDIGHDLGLGFSRWNF